MIQNKLIYFSSKSQFEREKQNVSPTSIVFVGDAGAIWTHHTWFCDNCNKCKGFYLSITELQTAHPKPEIGDWAIIVVSSGWKFGDPFPITFGGGDSQLVIAVCAQEKEWTITNVTYQFDFVKSMKEAIKLYFTEYGMIDLNQVVSDIVQSEVGSGQSSGTQPDPGLTSGITQQDVEQIVLNVINSNAESNTTTSATDQEIVDLIGPFDVAGNGEIIFNCPCNHSTNGEENNNTGEEGYASDGDIDGLFGN